MTINDNSITYIGSLSEEQLKEIETLKTMSDEQIDTIDIPEATAEQLASGHLYYADSLKMPKTGIHVMMDDDNLEWLKNPGKGYQPRLNNVLRWA